MKLHKLLENNKSSYIKGSSLADEIKELTIPLSFDIK